MKTSKASIDQLITQSDPKAEACKADYPLVNNDTVGILYHSMMMRQAFMRKYGLFNASYDLLLMMWYKWEREHSGSSVYSLCNGNRNQITRTASLVTRLYGLGFIEVIGTGVRKCRVYIPTQAIMSEITGIGAYQPIAQAS